MVSRDWGGVERYILDVSTAMRAKGHDVSIIARDYPEVTHRFIDSGFKVVTAPLSKSLDFISPRRLALMANGDEPVIIHVHTFREAVNAILAKKISRNKNVHIVITRHIVKSASNSRLNRFVYRNTDAVVFVSKLARDTFLSTNPDIDCGKLHVIHNSVANVSHLPSVSICPNPDLLKVLFLGRLCRAKGVEVLLKAFSLIPDESIRIYLLGDGEPEYVGSLAAIARRLGVSARIEFLGYHEDVHPFIEGIGLVVCPSLVKESFCLSALEGMAHGKAVIATDNGGQAEFIDSGVNGILVPPDDAVALADAIMSLRNDSTHREYIGRNAVDTFNRELSFDGFVSKLHSVYEDVIWKRDQH